MKGWLVAFFLLMTTASHAETWRFAMIGDVPYSDFERQELPHMLNAISERDVQFVAHIGDFKHGRDRCDDQIFEDRFQVFNATRVPFIFVPGDNEWSDCERISNGAYDPLERLGKLRSMFWNDSFSLGKKKFPLERQAGNYPEHSRFRLGPVLFVTLNLPGGNNNFGLTDVARPEFLARNQVTLAWLKENFALARKEMLAGIVLLFQANPEFGHFSKGLTHGGYRDFLEALRNETQTFNGDVLVVHGDSHMARIDHPMRNLQGKQLPNFTRVETFGYPIMGWTLGIIDSSAPGLFRFETHPWPSKAKNMVRSP